MTIIFFLDITIVQLVKYFMLASKFLVGVQMFLIEEAQAEATMAGLVVVVLQNQLVNSVECMDMWKTVIISFKALS